MFALLLVSLAIAAEKLPERPAQADHPGSANYSFAVEKQSFQIEGRTVDVFMPAGVKERVPVVVYGHGQATPLSGYQATLEHLARKGVAAIFPQFDSGFFDQDWRRMADDFNRLTKETFQRYPMMNPDQVVYAGHSKGAYIALMAAGAPRDRFAKSVVVFEPAGYDAEYIKALDPRVPVTITWADRDTVTKLPAIREIYEKLSVQRKQLITVVSYTGTETTLPADHFFVLSKKFFFGGREGTSPLHYFGEWKWLLGAVWDLQSGANISNPYIYGNEATSTGLNGLKHSITKNW
jgi:dienelactone hydrolase